MGYKYINDCPICSSTSSKIVLRDSKFKLYRCSYCITTWISPRLDSSHLAELYQEEYWKSNDPSLKGYANYFAEKSLYIKTFTKRWKMMRSYIPNKKTYDILDIGCSNGVFLEVVDKHISINGMGIDISKSVIDEASSKIKKPNLVFENIRIEELNTNKKFDIITMWDVIEHVEHPVDVLNKVYSLLKRDGIIVFETQNINSILAKISGKKWHHYKHNEHIYHFNRKSIKNILDKSRFSILKMTSNCTGKYVSLSFIKERLPRFFPFLKDSILLNLFNNKKNIYINPRDELIVIAKKKINV